MSNGQTTEKKLTTEEKIKKAGSALDEFGKTMETLFGQSQPAPYVPSHVSTGPPQVTGGTLPPGEAAGPRTAPPVPGVMQTGTEFRTSQGAKGAVVGGAIQNIAGAIHGFAQQKQEGEIRHAKFLYDLVKTSYEGGDERMANLIMGDPKNRKIIEKYITGKIPMVPGGAPGEQGGQPQAQGAPQGGQPQSQPAAAAPPPAGPPGINQPGGPALPMASQQQRIESAIRGMIEQGVKEQDPRIMARLLGEQATMSKEDFAKATRVKYGIEMSPAQEAALNMSARNTLVKAKADMIKTLSVQAEVSERLKEIQRMRGESAEKVGAGHDRARIDAMRMYSAALKQIRGAPADKMEQILYKSMGDLSNKMATTLATQAAKLEKDNPDLAKIFKAESDKWAQDGKHLKDTYDANKFYEQFIEDEGGTAEVPEEEEDTTPTTTEEPD